MISEPVSSAERFQETTKLRVKPPRGFLWRIRTWLHLPIIILGVWLAEPSPRLVPIGLALVMLGLLGRSWALGYIRKDDSLCTHGPYALVRHPLYLFSLVILAGLLVVAGNPLLAWILGPLAVTYYWLIIRAEDRWLVRRFGEEWQRYAAAVPALIPRPGGLLRVSGRKWKLSIASGNQLLLNWVTVAVVTALLVAHPLIEQLFSWD